MFLTDVSWNSSGMKFYRIYLTLPEAKPLCILNLSHSSDNIEGTFQVDKKRKERRVEFWVRHGHKSDCENLRPTEQQGGGWVVPS